MHMSDCRNEETLVYPPIASTDLDSFWVIVAFDTAGEVMFAGVQHADTLAFREPATREPGILKTSPAVSLVVMRTRRHASARASPRYGRRPRWSLRPPASMRAPWSALHRSSNRLKPQMDSSLPSDHRIAAAPAYTAASCDLVPLRLSAAPWWQGVRLHARDVVCPLR
jgi:hypothetical protein